MEYLEPYFDADDTEKVFDTPIVELDTVIGRVALTHLNSRIRLFDNSMANHIEFVDEEDNLRAFSATKDLINSLRKLGFPTLKLPYIDRATGVWLNEMAAVTLESDLNEL